MAITTGQWTLLCAIGIVLLARPAHAFGAGNIGSTSAIEGQNWRHGDIEDVLLTLASARAMSGKKFSKLDVKRVYFGNWLRDYSQAVDVGTVKYVSAKAITLLLWILGFMSFGYGTGEFEVTMERLGCYRPEDHIDNPKGYAEGEDARQYDRRLRGPINERKELAVDPETGLKAYIASENLGIMTSAAHVRRLFTDCIQLGRRYGHNKNKPDLYEALRLLGTACHCLEDFPAHSNYVELALIELGERDVFPHVGRDTEIRLRGARHPVYPIITGTFGGVDFLHSVTGEFDDKVTQSEIQELENTMQTAQNNQANTSMLQDLLNKVPSGMFGDQNEAGKVDELKANSAAHQMQNTHISPREPEEWANYLDDIQKQIYPIIQFHDEVMQGITETIEKIPILPALIENLQEQLNIFVFSLIAPYILPVIKQIKVELNTGSSAIIQSSEEQQHIVFSDDRCSDPTHSMLSKDHFSNVLNEPAGKTAGQIIKWVVPQIVQAWDDDNVDVDRTINRIIRGVFHHPALRDSDNEAADGRRQIFGVVEQWWHSKDEREKDTLRRQLSRDGVQSGRNHKPGVVDHGHGSGKPLGMPKSWTTSSSGAPGGSGFESMMGGSSSGVGQIAASAVGGGALGAIVGGLASNIGADILGGGMDEGRQTYNRTSYGDDGSRTQTVTQVGYSGHGDNYGQAQYTRTEQPYGGRTETYNRYEQTSTTSGWQSEVHHEEQTSYGGYHQETKRYEARHDDDENGSNNGNRYGRRKSNDDDDGHSNHGNRNRRRKSKDDDSDNHSNEGNQYGRRHGRGDTDMPGGFGSRHDDDDENSGRRYNQPESGGYGRRTEETGYNTYNRQEENSGFGSNRYSRQQEEETSYGSNRYGRQEEEPSYGRRRKSEDREEEPSYGRSYGRQEQSRDEDENTYGGGYGRRSQDEGESRGYGGDDNQYGSRNDGEDDYGNRRRSRGSNEYEY